MTTIRRLTVLRGARLFDGVDMVADPTVVLDGDRVVAVGAALGDTVPGADMMVFDDATILPGLVDTHVHLAFDASEDPVGALVARSPAETVEAMTAAARATVLAGVTTVRDLGDRDYLTLALSGGPGLPRIVAAGPPLTPPGGDRHFLGGAVEPTQSALRAAVRDRAERGCEVITIMAGGFWVPELRTVVDEAHRHGIPVTAHAHTTTAIENALDAGVDGLEHASSWAEEDVADLLDVLVARQVVLGATLGTTQVGVLPRLAAFTALVAAGARFVVGTDAGAGPPKAHSPLPYVLAQLTGLGLSPLDVLRTITSTAAQVCGLAGSKGRLAPGFDADVLVVGGDPRVDPAALLNVRAVYVGGRIVS